MRLHLAPGLAGEILVVENDGPGRAEAARPGLLAEYGRLAPSVRFVPAATLGTLAADAPGTGGAGRGAGWWNQQALKLLAARAAAHPRAVLLDAKNHLVGPLEAGFLSEPDGRLRARRYCYRSHPLRHFLERTLGFFGLPAEPHLGCFMQAETPFCLARADAAAAVATVERRAAAPLAAALAAHRITEFFALAASLIGRGGLERAYAFTARAAPVVWAGADGAALDRAIGEAAGAPVFGLHRDAIATLDGAARDRLARFWASRGLFGSPARARAALDAMGPRARVAARGDAAWRARLYTGAAR